MSGKILGVMSDLFFTVKIIDAAKKIGLTAEFVKEKPRALEKAKDGPAMIVVDLNCDAADPLRLIAAIKGNPETSAIPMIGFVSHVQVELKQKAEAAGCDTVVARSVFAERLPDLLANAASSPAAD
jgi:CheY-like chemotaxis protein